MVEQRIYIPYATDNWLVWVRIPPGVPKIIFLREFDPLRWYQFKQIMWRKNSLTMGPTARDNV